jgi:hypothetical protein
VLPPRHIREVFRGRRTPRLECVALARTPPPCLLEVVCEGTLEELDDVFADVWEEFEGVAFRGSSQHQHRTHDWEGIAERRGEGRITHPESPVARIKFFHCGCSHTSSDALAVSVHQHNARLNSGFCTNWGKYVSIALRMETSEAFGYVSVGCAAWERGTETRLGDEAP